MGKVKTPQLSAQEAEKILQEVFLECYEDTNSIPVEQMEQYSNYRSERLSLQKVVAIVGFVMFMLLPVLFVSPRFLVAEANEGVRNLPVYTIQVRGILPIKSVTVVQDKYSLPVYQRKTRQFSVEPTSNGKITVCVTLFSGQWYSKEILVKSVDNEAPECQGTSSEAGYVYIYLSDEGSGIDFDSAYLLDEEGAKSSPYYFDTKEEYIEIEDSFKGTLFISDNAGNTLELPIQ